MNALVALIVYTPGEEAAVNVTATPVLLLFAENVPQAVPLQPVPETDQFTPSTSFVVAVILNVCPVTRAARLGETPTVRFAALTVILKVTDWLCTVALESCTPNTRDVALAEDVGVPVIVPVLPFSERPVGSVPLVIVHVYGEVPPVAASVALYAIPTCPFGKLLVVIVRPEALMVRLRFTLWLCAGLLESVTVNFKAVAFADAVGVPVIVPALPFSERPAGSVPLAIVHL